MRLPRLQAVLFDLDGTLVDSEKPGLDVLHRMACGLGLNWSHEESLRRFRGVPMARCVSDIARELPRDRPALDEVQFLKDLRAAMAERFRQDLQEIPGASALLDRKSVV